VFADGAIVAAAPGLLYRLEPKGTPALFPGSEASVVPVGTQYYDMAAMAVVQDDSAVTNAGFSGAWDIWELSHVSASGRVDKT
jgi:hypothetical protein